MSTSQSRLRAASLVSRHLTSQHDVALIGDLLRTAAGDEVVHRSVSITQYDLLDAHRVLSLVPPYWTTPAERDLAGDKRQLALQQLKLVAEARRVISHLATDGVDCRVLKGLATSELDYDNQAQRTFGDVDLLVRSRDFDRSLRSLMKLGAALPAPGPPGYEFRKAATPVLESGTEIDVHCRLTQTTEPPEVLFEHPTLLAACDGLALPAELRLLHAASHLMYSPPGMRRLSGLADISALRARHNVDLDALRDHAASMNCEALVAVALRVERVLCDHPVDTDHWAKPTWLERTSFARGSRHLLAEHALWLSYLDGSAQQARYLANWALPNRAAAAKRGGFVPYFRRLLPQRLGGQTGGDAI